jgi:hypothetical protein
MKSHQEMVPVELAGGAKMQVEATRLGGEEDVAFNVLAFQDVTDTVESIAAAMNTALQRAKPKKASIEFGLEIGIESGKLTTLLVKGTGTANLKIALEWGE